MMVTQHTFAQIPFEVMVGNNQTQYFAYVQKDIDSIGRWNVFSQSFYTVNYSNSSLNAISSDNQLTYQLNDWLGISAGGTFDGLKFNPTLGLSIGYMNKKGDLIISTFPTVQLSNPKTLDFFALINYSPKFNKNWGLFSQFILGTNVGLQKEFPTENREIWNLFTKHNLSNQLVRIGLSYKQKYQFGFGTDFAQFGMNEGSLVNIGCFFRLQLD
jgi:hypothetical protein